MVQRPLTLSSIEPISESHGDEMLDDDARHEPHDEEVNDGHGCKDENHDDAKHDVP